MAILYAPLNTSVMPRQGMQQPDFYTSAQTQQQQPVQPTTLDFVKAQLERIKQRPALPGLTPGSRVQNISSSVSSPDNFQSYYKQLATIKQIGQEQVARAQAEAALAQIRAQQSLNQYNAAAPRYSISGGGGGGNTTPSSGRIGSAALPTNPRENFKYAQGIAGNYGWGNPSELAAWYTLGMKESGWRNTAQNPTSTAYGIGQFLNSTWKGVGMAKTSDPALQVEAMARYIRNRYGSPSKALAFHYKNNWY